MNQEAAMAQRRVPVHHALCHDRPRHDALGDVVAVQLVEVVRQAAIGPQTVVALLL